MKKLLRVLVSLTFLVLVGLAMFGGSVSGNSPAQAADLNITDQSFNCLNKMTKVRHFFVSNLLGNVEATVAAANAPNGAKYPAGSVVQLVPTEVMVKHKAGWNAGTNDWEFFELEVSAEGSKIKKRGTTDVINRFGGNCFTCHSAARPEWDLICESEHGCKPIPVTRVQIAGIQAADPRCKQ